VTLGWNPDSGSAIAGYRLYQGGASRTYTNVMAAGNLTNLTVSSLASGATYFFAVTAYNTNAVESDYSSEISYTVPVPTNLPPSLPPAVPVFVQQSYATPQSPATQVTVAYPSAQTAGNANLLAIGWNDVTASIVSVSDSAGNIYQAAVPTYQGNGLSQAIYYSAGIQAGNNTVTVTFNQAAVAVDLRVTEYAGVAPANTLVGGSSGTGISASASSGTVSTTATNQLLFGAGMVAHVFTGAGPGFTSRVITTPDGDMVEDMVVSAPGSYAATATVVSGAWLMQVAAFNAAVLSTNPVVNYAPVITVQPTGVTSSAMAGFTVSLTATGTPALVYQWRLSGTNISGATTASYSQAPAATSQSGNYNCVVANSFGSVTSAVATVLITNVPLPSIVLTAPANGASYVAPATIPLAASVTANGHTITQVQFYNGATLLGSVAAAPYSLSWNNVSAGSYSLSATAVYDSGSTVASTAQSVTVTVPAPPPPSTVLAFVQQNYATPQSSQTKVAVAYTNSQTAGNANVVAIGWNDTSASISSVSDSAGNVYQAAVPTYRGNGLSQAIYYSAGIKAGGNTVTVTFNQAAVSVDLRVAEYSGLAPANTLVGGSSGTGISASASSGTVSATTTNQLLFGAGMVAHVFTGAGAGFTSRVITKPDGDIAEDRVASAPGSYAATATVVSGAWLMQVAAFNAAVLSTNGLLPSIALTAPVNGASYGAPAAISLAASVTANGHTITKVQFYNGSTLLVEEASAPYSFVWTNVAAGSYSLMAQAVYDSGSTVASAAVNLTVTGLPAPWQMVDIGNVAVPGNANISGGLYTVAGAGQISGSADSFRFLYQTLSGDGQIDARISSMQNTGTAGGIGVMIRESLTSGSEYSLMGISPNGTFRWQRRTSTGGTTTTTTSSTGTPPNAWARLVRTNGVFYGYNSTNGTIWTLLGSQSITMATNIYVGLAVASGTSNVLNSTTFTNVIVVP
jgi:sulfur relay (sulfurtransferase) complex TusBCD TusD component (DsrE family)